MVEGVREKASSCLRRGDSGGRERRAGGLVVRDGSPPLSSRLRVALRLVLDRVFGRQLLDHGLPRRRSLLKLDGEDAYGRLQLANRSDDLLVVGAGPLLDAVNALSEALFDAVDALSEVLFDAVGALSEALFDAVGALIEAFVVTVGVLEAIEAARYAVAAAAEVRAHRQEDPDGRSDYEKDRYEGVAGKEVHSRAVLSLGPWPGQ